MVNVMLIHDVFDLCRAHVMAQLGEGVTQIRARDRVITVSIKSLEERLDALWRRILIHRECGCDELMIIYDTVTVDIYLLDDVLQFLFGQIGVTLANSISQLSDFDRARSIFVDLVEFFTKIGELFGVDHFDENIEAFSSKFIASVEVCQTL